MLQFAKYHFHVVCFRKFLHRYPTSVRGLAFPYQILLAWRDMRHSLQPTATTVKFGWSQNCLNSYEVRYCNEPSDKELPPTSELTGWSGIRTSERFWWQTLNPLDHWWTDLPKQSFFLAFCGLLSGQSIRYADAWYLIVVNTDTVKGFPENVRNSLNR